jgi:hypothetical protein
MTSVDPQHRSRTRPEACHERGLSEPSGDSEKESITTGEKERIPGENMPTTERNRDRLVPACYPATPGRKQTHF